MNWLFGLKQNKYLYLGGYRSDGSYIYYDDILEFDPLTGQWKEVAKMMKARSNHAVSVIEYSEVAQFCNWGGSRFSRVRDWWILSGEMDYRYCTYK